jgi:hypothetical protein
MSPADAPEHSPLPIADAKFFETFLPYEIRLAQRRAMVWGAKSVPDMPVTFFGIYLARLEPTGSRKFPGKDDGGGRLGQHLYDLLRSVLRDSDVPGWFKNQEHIVVARDINPEQAYVIAERFLTAARKSEVLTAAQMKARIGYVIYPLSSPPNFPVDKWSILIDLARLLSLKEPSNPTTAGYGLVRGDDAASSGVPEADLIPLALQNPEAMVEAGLIKLQRVQLL